MYFGAHTPLDDVKPLGATYLQTAAPAIAAEPLLSGVLADVAVVGAGFTGLSAALHLAESGARVVILEANEAGAGGSGRAFGQVVPYLKHGEDTILSHFGDAGPQIIDRVGKGPDLVFGLIARHSIECEAVRTGLLFGAHTASAALWLERRARFWQGRSAPVEMLDRKESEKLTGSSYYPIVLFDRRGGSVNPLGYCRGLAAAAIAAGARLYVHSRACALDRDAQGWQVRTATGAVRASQVLLATDAYTDGLWPGLAESLVPLRGYHVVSKPLDERSRRLVLPGLQSLTDTRHLYSGIRVRLDGRLHLSCDGPAFRNDANAWRHKATRRVADLFPDLPPVEWHEEMAGWVAMTADQFPHLHSLAAGLWAAVGLNGRGIAAGTLLGADAAERMTRQDGGNAVFPVTPLAPVRVRRFARPLVGGLMNLYRVVDALHLRGQYRRRGH